MKFNKMTPLRAAYKDAWQLGQDSFFDRRDKNDNPFPSWSEKWKYYRIGWEAANVFALTIGLVKVDSSETTWANDLGRSLPERFQRGLNIVRGIHMTQPGDDDDT